MKPVRATLLAALAAAVLATPISSAEAHKRHRGHDAVPAIALGLFAGAILGNSLHPHHRGHGAYYEYAPPYGNAGTCQGLSGGEYEVCMSQGGVRPGYRAPSYRVVPRHHHRNYYQRHNDPYYPGPGVNIIIGR